MSTSLLPDEHIIERLERRVESNRQLVRKLLDQRVQDQDFDLALLTPVAYELAAQLVLLGRSSERECGDMLALAGNAEAYALYLAQFPRGERSLEVVLPGRNSTILRQSTGSTSSSTPAHWFKAFYLTLLWNEEPVLKNILMRTTQATLRASSTNAPDYRYWQVEAAQALYMGRSDAPEKMMSALDGMQADTVPPDVRDFAADIAMSEAGMMYRLGLQDEAAFNAEVELALERHVNYYGVTEKRRNSPDAWFCLPALGWCAYARLRGMQIKVESPLLPLELISV